MAISIKKGRRSTSGYIFLLSDGPVSWQSKRQTVVAVSTPEAEYIGQFNAAREAVWIRTFLEELGLRDLIAEPLEILADNNPALKLSKDPTSHSRAKHMDIKFHWQRQEIERNTLKITYIPSGFNAADGLTKPLDPQPFYAFKNLTHVKEFEEQIDGGDNGEKMDIDGQGGQITE